MTMCGRYVLKHAEQIPLRFDATADDAVRAALADRFNIAPTEPVPVVIEEPSGLDRNYSS
jgi:putative SOS response-associated peptidase YedK